MAAQKKLIIGNWKMYPTTVKEAKHIFASFKKIRRKDVGVTTVICPPFVFLNEVKQMYTGTKIFFGVQDVFWQAEGAYTGEVSVEMVQSVGARFVIVGHSERRALGETNEVVSQKARAAIKAGMHTVVCIGEGTRDAQGNYLRFLKEQVHESLRGISRTQTKNLIIAYEPVWAIGQGNYAMSPHDIQQTTLFIQKQLVELYGRKIAMSVTIIYGGSVDETNAHILVHEGGVDGLLIGRKSLHPEAFSMIIEAVAQKPKK